MYNYFKCPKQEQDFRSQNTFFFNWQNIVNKISSWRYCKFLHFKVRLTACSLSSKAIETIICNTKDIRYPHWSPTPSMVKTGRQSNMVSESVCLFHSHTWHWHYSWFDYTWYYWCVMYGGESNEEVTENMSRDSDMTELMIGNWEEGFIRYRKSSIQIIYVLDVRHFRGI